MVLFNLNKITRVLTLGILLLFLLLIYKDPFSERSLIPNFEPYPDTFYYINPALNLVRGQGFSINREGRILNVNVPPLYSFSLIPAFLIKVDPRMAYYSNVVLAFVSLSLFYLILKKISTNKLVIYLLLILYTTNYFIYWVPTIIMGENLILVLYLATLYFLLSEITKKNSIAVALLSAGTYATKFSSIPVCGSIILLFLGKVLFSQLKVRLKMKRLLLFLLTLSLSFIVLGIFLAVTRHYNIVDQILANFSLIRNSVPKDPAASKAVTSSASWFGLQYVQHNLSLYINSLMGSPNRFLWDNTPLVPKFVAIGGIIGILGGISNKKVRFISLALFTFILSSMAFQSTFYSFDVRYIYIALPSLLLGFGLLLTVISRTLTTKRTLVLNSLILTLIIIYLVTSFIRIKSQISLNLRYAETPWNYIAVLKMNEYFTKDKIVDSKKPVLISALPPFLIDYYSNGNYTLLPLSYDQEFRGQTTREIVWGPNDYSDLPKLYRKYLNEGYDLYMSRAGLGNEGYTNNDFNIIVENFNTQLVLPGCYDQCNIYRVRLKSNKL